MFNRIFNRRTRDPRVTKDYMEVLSDSGAIIRIQNPSALPNGGFTLQGDTIHCAAIDGDGVSFCCPAIMYFGQFHKWITLHGFEPNSQESVSFCEKLARKKDAGKTRIVR